MKKFRKIGEFFFWQISVYLTAEFEAKIHMTQLFQRQRANINF